MLGGPHQWVRDRLEVDEMLKRTVFGRRRTGTALFTEPRVRQFGPVATLEVSGRF